MPKDFIPARDEEFADFVSNFSTLVTAAPTSYGLTAAIATTLSGKVSAFTSARTAATNPGTRGPATVLAKDIARRDLEGYVRQLARAVQGTLTVTDPQRQALGLTVRDKEPSPIPPPATAPQANIVSVNGNTVRVRLTDPAFPTKRGRPDGVDGAAIFSHVGEEAPNTEAEWTFEGNTTKTTIDVVFPPATAPGAKVWFTAFWFNPKAQSGPAATPVSTNIAGGSAMAA
jgi:hypothetical protein